MMEKKRRIGLVVFLVSAILICIASAGYSGDYGYSGSGFSFAWGSTALSSERTFDMTGIQDVRIEYGSVNVVFGEADGEECVVKEYLRRNHKDAETEMKVDGDTLLIRRRNNYSVISIFGIGGSGPEKVEILLPESYRGNVTVETGSGNIGADTDLILDSFYASSGSGNIRCLNVEAGEIKVSAGSGNISIERAEGSRDISTGSGNIHILGGAGDTFVSAGSGNISLEGVEGRMDGSAGSGNIRAVFGNVTDDISLTTTSGDIRLEIPGQSSFSYEGNSTSGSIRTDFDGALEWNKKRNHAMGSYGSGSGVQVHTEASSGNTTVKLR